MPVHQCDVSQPRYYEQLTASQAVSKSKSGQGKCDVHQPPQMEHPLHLVGTNSITAGPNLNSYRYEIKTPGTEHHYDQEVVQQSLTPETDQKVFNT